MTDVAFMGDDEDFNTGYDLLEPVEQFERRREQLLNEEKIKIIPYIRDYYLTELNETRADVFAEMILYISESEYYDWIYDRLRKIAEEYLITARLRFNLEQREIGIIAYIHSNTLDSTAIQYAKDILFAAMEMNDYIENRPPPQPPRTGIEPIDYSNNRIPWHNESWEPVTIFEKEILVYRRHLIAADHITLPDELKVKDSNGVDYGISRWNLTRYPTNEDDAVKVTLIEQRTWIFVSWTDTPRDYLYLCPNSSNTEDYIMVKRIFHDNRNCRIFFADRKQAVQGAFNVYPRPPPEYDEEEEDEVVAPMHPPPRVVRRAPASAPTTNGFAVVLPVHIGTIIVNDYISKGESCPITMDPFTLDTAAITSCFHLFDYNAIKTWIETSQDCPVCRQRLTWLFTPFARS